MPNGNASDRAKQDAKNLIGDVRKKDKDFVITRYVNLPFLIAQSRTTKLFYQLDKDGKHDMPMGGIPNFNEKALSVLASHNPNV